MQIYKVYRLFRGVFCLLMSTALLLPVFAHTAKTDKPIDALTPLDTLYSRWNKTEGAYPYLGYEVTDFDSRPQAFSVISQYELGAVFISNGESKQVQEWIEKTKYSMRIHPLFTVEIKNLYELPFDGQSQSVTQLEVECITDQTLIYELGKYHGIELVQMGFDVVQFEQIPENYLDEDWQKASAYLRGLKDAGLFFSVTFDQQKVIETVGWERTAFLERNFELQGKRLEKDRKSFRKESGFTGIYKEYFDGNRWLDKKHNLITEGAGMIILPTNPQIPKWHQTIRKSNKADIKKVVKSYFALWKNVKSIDQKFDLNIDPEQLFFDLHSQSKVLVKNDFQLLPLNSLTEVSLFTWFEFAQSHELVNKYKKSKNLSMALFDMPVGWVLEMIPKNAQIILSLNDLLLNRDEAEVIEKLDHIQAQRNVIVMLNGKQELLVELNHMQTLLWSPGNEQNDLLDMIQMVFGAEPILGRLPSYKARELNGSGEVLLSVDRLRHENLKNLSMDYQRLNQIDQIVLNSIQNEEMPGCQIMMVYKNQVVYDRNFGYLTYDSLMKVTDETLYDMASVTKTTVTVPAIMHLTETGQVNLNDSLGKYFPELDSTDKKNITLRDLMNHQSGLKSYYPFWKKAKFDTVANTYLYKQRKKRRRKSFDYFEIHWEDSVNAWVGRSDFNSLKKDDQSYGYLYSDLGFMLMKQIAERKSGVNIGQLVDSLMFRPMGMDHTFFNPSISRIENPIAPTEDDKYFRKKLLKGEVHDKNAALLGGTAGHAGLFSNANDMAKYMQMILNGGRYGGIQYFDSLTVKEFTTKVMEEHRRALGWDKPSHSVQNTSEYASDESFGHSGFSGTLVWADPKYDLIYIFLSNRIHPNPQNYKLIENNTRTKIQDIMYQSILSQDNSGLHDM